MKYYQINIEGLTRNLPLCPISDELYIGAFIIFGDPELSDVCAKALLKKAPEFDYIMTAEEAVQYGLVDAVLQPREIKAWGGY